MADPTLMKTIPNWIHPIEFWRLNEITIAHESYFENNFYQGQVTGSPWYTTFRWLHYSNVEGTSIDNTIHGNGAQTFDWYFGHDVTWQGGDDNIWGHGGNDVIYGHGGNDNLYGGADQDRLYGGDGNDNLYGGIGHDRLDGGEGNDLLDGGTGDDVLSGGNGTDTLTGGDGADWLVSGALTNGISDQLTGGSGADTFVLGEASKETTTPGQDWGKFFQDFGFSFFGDVNDTVFVGGQFDGKRAGKLAKEIVPGVMQLIEMVVGIAQADKPVDNPPAEAAYARVTDFNPLEDVILIPLNSKGPINIFLSLDSNGENAFTIKSDTTVGDGQDEQSGIIATISFADAAAIYGLDATKLSYQAKQAFLKTIMNNVLIVGGDGASVGLDNKVLLNIDPDVLASFGSSRFMILGAYAGMTLEGSNEDEYQFGTNHNDIIAGYALDSSGGIAFAPENAGNDELRGFGGDDLFLGGGGNDYIFGGSGSDTTSYVHSAAGVVVDLGTGLLDVNGTYGTAQDGFGGFDKLYDVENVFGSAFADDIRGSSADNILQGLAGNDTYAGRGGADRFILDAGVDRILDFSSAEGDKLVLSMNAHGIASFHDLAYVAAGADGIASLVNTVTGQTVAVLENMGGKTFDVWSDILLPGNHDGFVFGDAGDNGFVDQSGSQLYFGLGGADRISFAGAAGAVAVNLTAIEQDSNGAFVRASDGRGGEDRLYGIENLVGGNGDDFFNGNGEANILAGGKGNDMLVGGGGADVFIIDGGRDIVRDYDAAQGDRFYVDAAAYGITGVGDLSVRNGNELLAIIDDVEVSIMITTGGLRIEDVQIGGIHDFFG